MITKKIIKKALLNAGIPEEAVEEIAILSLVEFLKEASYTKKEAFDEFGIFDFILVFTKHKRFLTIEKDYELEDVQNIVNDWIKELKLIK